MLLQTTDSGSNNTGDLFVVTAATATLSMTGEKGSLRVDGLRPHTIWFADKPSRTGGQLDTNEFFGQEFLQNGQWIGNPNIAMYASNDNAGSNDDTVASLAILSNPQLSGTSVYFPLVSSLPSNNRPSSIASYYRTNAAGTDDGPSFIGIATTNTTTFSSVALFVDPYYCGCGCYGFCGCGWHDDRCYGGGYGGGYGYGR